MGRYLHHEPLANGLFNQCYNSAGIMTAWEGSLANTEELLLLVCERMEGDFCAQNARVRKAYGSREVDSCSKCRLNICLATAFAQEALLRSAGAFLACQKAFENKVPQKFFAEVFPSIKKSQLA